jgi:hypothetical protein
MTRELDPQLVEAVAIAINADEACWAGVNVWTNPEHGINEQTKWEYRRLATAAITSADAHRAAVVREAIANYRANVEANVQWGPGNNNILLLKIDALLPERGDE